MLLVLPKFQRITSNPHPYKVCLPLVYRFLCFYAILFLFPILLLAQPQQTRREYIERHKGLAIKNMEQFGVPASIILAQGILESGNGNSTLAVQANNHFGIKCHSTWTGPKVYHDDDAKGECFRKYRSVERSFQDHSEFLRGGRRYAHLFDLDPTDYKGWARGLSRAGYATNPQYASILIRIIEDNQLHQLDRGVDIQIESPTKGKGQLADAESFKIDLFKTRNVYVRNRIQYIEVRQGDTYQSLTRDLELMPWQLAKYNDIERNARLTPGQELYIQPKRRRADVYNRHHVVESGETMYDISQMYGIRLNALYRLNRMEQDDKPEEGDKIYLRRRRPAGD